MKPPLSQRFSQGSVVREYVRGAALTVLSTMLRKKTAMSLRTARLQNLYLHFLPADDELEFITLIRRLRRGHQIITYSEMVHRAKHGPIDQPYLTLSFDDGFGTNIRAARLLAEEGISACFFVCPDLIGESRGTLLETFPNSLGGESRCLTWDEVDEVLLLGHEVGSHTLTHPVLVELPFDEAARQIHSSKKVLEQHVGAIKHFAWPRGQFHHFSTRLLHEVINAGFVSCTSAVRGAHTKASEISPPCIYREHWVTGWPEEHLLYLMGRSVRKRLGESGQWPSEWNLK